MNDIGDIYMSRADTPYLVVNCEECAGKVYMFQLMNMYTGEVQSWLEPFDRQLAASYWTYLG